jgi:hypothetical protein
MAAACALLFACDDGEDPADDAPGDVRDSGARPGNLRDAAVEPAVDAGAPPDTPRMDSGAPAPDPDAARPTPDASPELPDAERPEPDAGADPADPDAAPDPPDPDPDAAVEPADVPPATYPGGRRHSPLTPGVVRRLRDVVEDHPDQRADVFAKVGASATVSRNFLACLPGDDVDLAGRDGLQSAIDHFAAGDAGGTDPFTRESSAAVVGWSALNVLEGAPAALDVELDAIAPRVAVVMYGTNDIQRRNVDQYAGSMMDLAERLLARGVIPILSSIMPRDDDPEADAEVPAYNGVVRGVAQALQVPFVDFHRELLPLPDHGLAGDQLHPSVYRDADGAANACDFTEAGLGSGYNIRNLVTLEALDRVRRHVLGDEAAPDRDPAGMDEAGTIEAPFRVTALPYTHLRDTRDSDQRLIDAYPGCDAPQDESGPELYYRLDLPRPTTIEALVLDRGSVDIDVHLMADPEDPGSCLQRAHTRIRASLDAGTWWFVLDTWVGNDGEPRPGEYLFVVVEVPE